MIKKEGEHTLWYLKQVILKELGGINVEENLKSKRLYKSFLILLKLLPGLIALTFVVNVVLSFHNIDVYFLSYIGGISLLPIIFIYIATYVFKFCSCHRMFLHYTVISNILAIIDYYIGIPVSDCTMLTIYLFGFFIVLIIILWLHLKYMKNAAEHHK